MVSQSEGRQKSGRSVTGKKSRILHKESLPICSEAEAKAWCGKLEKLSSLWRNNKITYREYEERREEIKKAKLAESATRAQKRPDEYINGLLIIVGNRCQKALRFEHVFTLSAERQFKQDLTAVDTPANRRTLHTLLSALASIPEGWSRLDFRRFISGTGEQGKSKNNYPGRGILGKNSGWLPGQIDFLTELIVGEASDFANVLRRHAPVTITPPQHKPEMVVEGFVLAGGPEPYSEREPRHTPRDLEFIRVLCQKLEARGL